MKGTDMDIEATGDRMMKPHKAQQIYSSTPKKIRNKHKFDYTHRGDFALFEVFGCDTGPWILQVGGATGCAACHCPLLAASTEKGWCGLS
jgi:hypothetical protein